jgi:hypothetical protein
VSATVPAFKPLEIALKNNAAHVTIQPSHDRYSPPSAPLLLRWIQLIQVRVIKHRENAAAFPDLRRKEELTKDTTQTHEISLTLRTHSFLPR